MSIIQVQNLSKSYIINHEGQERYTALRDVITNKARKLFSFPSTSTSTSTSASTSASSKEEFWALKDINFEINQGDRVGIIGRNGAGKSTLLKILSRITEPSSGSITIKGRVASLLEVGTGFHPELTGRENIFLNGAILGMSRAEIKKHFDAIVDFAEVERFLDTPVKRYSSGMYVRLAFAVAAHLEPEILIVDEVLAVGDAQFQKKCLGKMEDVSKNEGRTVLFVSHNMAAVGQLCKQAMLLENGKLNKIGATPDIVNLYLNEKGHQTEKIVRKNEIKGNHFQLIYLSDKDKNEKNEFRYDEDIFINVSLILPEYNNGLELAMRLMDKNKRGVFTIHERLENYYDGKIDVNVQIAIPKITLTPGNYSWVICINHPGIGLKDLHEDVLPITILETGSDFARYEGLDIGCVFAKYTIEKN